MHARVATFEGAEPEQVRRMAAEISTQAASGPTEGVPAVGLLLLHQPDDGKVVAITLFDREEDMKTADATLNSRTRRRSAAPQAGVRRAQPSLPGGEWIRSWSA
jgi:hypothetical protein